jgi:hypothetical protein
MAFFHSMTRSFVKEGRCVKDDLSFIYTIRQFTQVELQEIGLEKNNIVHMPQPCDSHNLARSDFYLFPTVTKRLELIQLADQNQFF